MPKLTIRRGATVYLELDLDGRELLIGRGGQSDVVLPDPTMAVSRVHAKLRQENGAYVLIDNDSQNGIWSQGEPHGQIVLEPGLEATIGEYTLALSDVAPAGYGEGPFPDGSETVYAAATLPSTVVPAKPAPPPRPPSSMRLSKGMLLGGCAFVLVFGLGLSYFMRPSCGSVGGFACKPVDPPAETITPPPADAPKTDAPGDPDRSQPGNEAVPQTPSNTTATTGLATTPRPGVPPPGPTSPDCRPGEKAADCAARVAGEEQKRDKQKRLANNLAKVRNDLDARNFREAINRLTEIEREEPNYSEVASLLARAREGLKNEAQLALQTATRADNDGDLVAAQRQYQRALSLDGSLAAQVDTAVKALRERMIKEGNEAFNRARIVDATMKSQDAVPFYRKAIQYLPEGDPNREKARRRLEELRGNQ